MSVNFIKSGQKVFVEKSPEGTRSTELAPALYTIECTREEGFFLVNIGDKYTIPEKTYGNHKQAAIRVIKTHESKSGNTGVLLTGLKGTGKSLFVKIISNLVIEKGIPVIQINKAFQGEDIFTFVENIGECALVFDEFGKNYSSYRGDRSPSQVGLLSLLDGLTNSKRLHLFTENNTSDISEFLINRPGRVHYHFKYNRLSNAVIEELCKDSGLPEDIIAEMLSLSNRLKVLSFDIVKCLIAEWKLYGGKIQDHIGILNVSMCNKPDEEEVEIISFKSADGVEIPKQNIYPKLSHGQVYLDLKNDPNQRYFDSSDVVLLEDAYLIDGDIYHFKTKSGSMAILRIKDGHTH